MNWQSVDKIFIGNATKFYAENYGINVDKQWILDNNPPYLERTVIQPLGNEDHTPLIYKYKVRYYRDGRVEGIFEYVAAPKNINGITALNAFGAKMLNNVIEKRKAEKND